MDQKLRNEIIDNLKIARTPFILDHIAQQNLNKTDGQGFYYEFKIDLSVAHVNEKYIFSGDRILVTQLDSPATIKLNSLKNQDIDLEKIKELKAPFTEFYLNNPAGSGYLKLLCGANGMFSPDLGTPAPKDWDVQSADASGGVAIITPTSGKRWKITDLIISTDTKLTLTLKDGATAKMILYLAVDGGAVINFKTPIISATPDNTFNITSSGAGNISVWLSGCEVD